MQIQTVSKQDNALKLLYRSPVTPALLVDLSALDQDYLAFRSAYRGARIFYAIKANPNPAIIRIVAKHGAGFEIASAGELRLLLGMGIEGSRIVSGNPVKTLDLIREGSAAGVHHYAFDSIAEVDKFAALAPQARLCVRLTVPNEGSEWPLDKKFGVESEEALELLTYAQDRGVRPAGIAFHVGSQCRNLNAWRVALTKARALWDASARRGIELEVLNIGGGMPVVYTDPNVPDIRTVGRTITDAAREILPPRAQVWLEPGRGVVGRCGTMVATVVGVAKRSGVRWVYLDVGVFHGLAEVIGGIKYRYLSDAPGPLEPCTLAGPSCDSIDVIAHGVLLPQVRVGDRVAIPAAGAYTTVYGSEFNGFPSPQTIVFESAADA